MKRNLPSTGTWGILTRCAIAILLCVAISSAVAHQGSRNIFFEGKVGDYGVRVVVQPPDVVPGQADVTVRVLDGEPGTVTVLPLKWNIGRDGAPTPDIATAVRGEPGLFFARIWFMEKGSQSIEVRLMGEAGEGAVQIPVPVRATRVETMPRGLGILLLLLGGVLVALLAGTLASAVREAALPPGVTPTKARRWAARLTGLTALIVLGGLLVGGKGWWDAEAEDYLNRRLYRPVGAESVVYNLDRRRVLHLSLTEPDHGDLSPLVPDHGKLMHLVLIRRPDLDALAHLHPFKLNRHAFVAGLPDLPAGEYELHAQLTRETGFAETITNRVTLSPFESNQRGGGIGVQPDPDDSHRIDSASEAGRMRPREHRSPLGDGYTLEWLNADEAALDRDVSLRFIVRDADGAAVQWEHYMGMAGHLFMRGRRGESFVHLHPAGSYSMVAQQLFNMRAAGLAPTEVNRDGGDPYCSVPSVDASQVEWDAQLRTGPDRSIGFPWKFVETDDYRIWVQVKVDGTIRTGVFDVGIKATP